MATDARGESSVGGVGTLGATAYGPAREITTDLLDDERATTSVLQAFQDVRVACPSVAVPTTAEPLPDAGERYAVGLETVLRARGWVRGELDWTWSVDADVHARVLTSGDGGACLVLGDVFPGDWSGHLDGATLIERLPDVERHRTGTTLPAWAVTDSVLAEAVSTVDPRRSPWHAFTVVRGADHRVTLTTASGPHADRRPRITFVPRPARDVTRSPQTVRLELDGHPVRMFWARRLPVLAHLLLGHRDPAADLCDVSGHVAAAWELHDVLEPRGGWCFTGSCHGTWRRGHPLHPVVTISLTRTPGDVVVALCGSTDRDAPAKFHLTADLLRENLDEIEQHEPGRPLPSWPVAGGSATWQCLPA